MLLMRYDKSRLSPGLGGLASGVSTICSGGLIAFTGLPLGDDTGRSCGSSGCGCGIGVSLTGFIGE